MASAIGSKKCDAGVPIPKFASPCSRLSCDLRNRDTSRPCLSFLDLTFHAKLAERPRELQIHHTSGGLATRFDRLESAPAGPGGGGAQPADRLCSTERRRGSRPTSGRNGPTTARRCWRKVGGAAGSCARGREQGEALGPRGD